MQEAILFADTKNVKTRRNPDASTDVRHASTYVLPITMILSIVLPKAAATLLPLAIATSVVAVVDSVVWIALWQVRQKPIVQGLCSEPHAITQPLVGNAMHVAWVLVCFFRGSFDKVPANLAALVSTCVAIPYYVLAVVLKPYAYALTKYELLGVGMVGAVVATVVCVFMF